MKKILLLGAAALVASACSKEGPSEPGPQQGDRMVVEASLEEGSRTSLDENLNVLWSEGDRIGLMTETQYATGQEFTLQRGAGTTVASFSGPAVEGQTFYAFYPYDAEVTMTSAKRLTLTLPAVQRYVRGGFAPGSNPMVAYGDDPTSLSFRNLCGVIKLQLTGPANTTVRTIEFTSTAGKAVSGEGDVVMIYGQPGNSADPVFNLHGTQPASVRLDHIDAVLDPSTPEAFHIVVPAGTYTGVQFTIYTDQGTMIKRSDKSFTVNRSRILPFTPFAFAAQGIESATATFYGQANCIEMLPEQTSVTFDCAPYFTASDTYAYQKATDASLPRAASAALLWCDTKDNLVGVQLDEQQQTLTVTKAAGDTGNAVVAIYDQTGVLLWSFHIWAHNAYPDKAITTKAGNVYQMMDLNLGATVNGADPLSLGLFYQWGRKDPFRGVQVGEGFTSVSDAPTYGPGTWETAPAATVADAIAKPMCWLANSTNGNWLTVRDERLWGNPFLVNGPEYDGKVVNGEKGNKSVYDPCPAGYRVVPHDTFTGFTASGASATNPDQINKQGDWQYGWYFSLGGASAETSFFPAAGRRNNSDATLGNTGGSGYYWTSSMRPNGSSWSGVLSFTNYTAHPLNGTTPAYGCPVRCVKE